MQWELQEAQRLDAVKFIICTFCNYEAELLHTASGADCGAYIFANNYQQCRRGPFPAMHNWCLTAVLIVEETKSYDTDDCAGDLCFSGVVHGSMVRGYGYSDCATWGKIFTDCSLCFRNHRCKNCCGKLSWFNTAIKGQWKLAFTTVPICKVLLRTSQTPDVLHKV